MTKIERRRRWKRDIIATEEWLSDMHKHGYALKEASLKTGKFVFEDASAEPVFYRIGYDKQGADVPQAYLENGFEKVCAGGNYYIIKTRDSAPAISPVYDDILDKNIKKKFVIGMILLCNCLIFGTFALSFFIAGLISIITGDMQPSDFIFIAVADLIFAVPTILLALSFKRLAKVNKKLEAKCGNPLNLSWTIPLDTLLSTEEVKRLKKEKRYVKKTKLGWFYAPDKAEKWLQDMEAKGFNLVRMSKPGASFYFIKGTPRKIKYHVDYQNKTNPMYYNLHKENGWKLFFTSLTRIQSFTLWAKEYADEVPQFYSNNQSLIKHAKRIMITYSVTFLPLSILYVALLVWQISIFFKSGNFPWFFLPLLILYPIIVIEYSYFAIKTIRYYFRIRKSTQSDAQDDL